MKLYALTIRPLSGFGTPLKGDTIFGHFCWQFAYDSTLLNGGFQSWVDKYQQQPFAVFSSAYPTLSRKRASICPEKTGFTLLIPVSKGCRERQERMDVAAKREHEQKMDAGRRGL